MSQTSSCRTHPRRHFSREYKLEVCELLPGGAAIVAEVARTYDLDPNLLFRWRAEYLRGDYGPVREAVACESRFLPVELIAPVEMGHSVSIASASELTSKAVSTTRLRRLRIVLAKCQMHLEDVDTQTLGLLIEALR